MSDSEGTQKLTFEEAIKRIQTAVKKLESSDISLEDALSTYQDGLGYVKKCQEQLQSVETKLQRLTQEAREGKKNA